ncbi:hypothetical protein C8Q80DRAFT_1201753 [Daedaleopsis nitida]|nr:hypothetical protein C8Q80DRAFT_1201753 [Daedaleopsis nitida]
MYFAAAIFVKLVGAAAVAANIAAAAATLEARQTSCFLQPCGGSIDPECCDGTTCVSLPIPLPVGVCAPEACALACTSDSDCEACPSGLNTCTKVVGTEGVSILYIECNCSS